MGTMVLPHVDDLSGLAHCPEGGLHDGFRFTHESHHGAVSGLTGVHIEQAHAFHALYLIGNLFDDCRVAALAEVGHAFDNLLFHCVFIVLFRLYVK